MEGREELTRLREERACLARRVFKLSEAHARRTSGRTLDDDPPLSVLSAMLSEKMERKLDVEDRIEGLEKELGEDAASNHAVSKA